MAYKVYAADGDVIAESDCLYDFNGLLPEQVVVPEDQDYQSISDEVERRLINMGYSVEEVF